MILNSIQGILTEKQIDYACCLVGGVEWQVAMSEQSLARLPAIGAEVQIYTQLKVSENNIALYGFALRDERSLFEALISVPGIGPKVALGMLSKAAAAELAACIIQGDAKRLAQLPGLGSKTAQKLILQLGDKLEKHLLLAGATLSVGAAPSTSGTAKAQCLVSQEYGDLLDALVAMGYEERRSREVLDELFAQWQQARSSETAEAADGLPPEGERLRQAIVRLA